MSTAHWAANCVASLPNLLAGPERADRPFLINGTSFGEVYAQAKRLRALLDGFRQQTVCLATEDRALIAAALLAALGGGPPLLLPHAGSPQALAAMQRDTGFTAAIADAGQALPPGVVRILPQAGDPERALQPADARPGETLLCLHTGGSTGTPRLWPKTGVNIFGEAQFLARHFRIGPADRILATVPSCHIYGLLYAVALPLVAGASVATATPSFPEEILGQAREAQATILVSVPAHYRALRGRPALGDWLRLAFSSAGMLDAGDNVAFCQANPAGIVEVYGSTETGGIALRNRSRGETAFTPYPMLDWRIDGERLRLRSPFLSPTLPLDAGSRFVAGDRVEPCESGFTLKGRADAITKVAGRRVDLDEIRALIREQQGVADCLVLALADGGSREHRIVALIEGEEADAGAIRAALASRLEPYALPRALKTIDRIPVRANGKFDREAIVRLFQP